MLLKVQLYLRSPWSQEKYLEWFGISLRTVDLSPEQFTALLTTHIAQRGLEILLECEFKIDVTKMDLLKRLE